MSTFCGHRVVWLVTVIGLALLVGGPVRSQSVDPSVAAQTPLEPLVPFVLTQMDRADDERDLTQPVPEDDPVPPLAVSQLDSGRDRLQALTGGQRLSLRFGEPLPITELLLFLFRDTPFSIVTEPGVDGDFIGELKNVTLIEALGLVLAPHALDYSVQNTSITVFRRRMEARIFPVDSVSTSRGAEAGDLFDDLGHGVETLLSEQGRYNVDRKAALLQVTDYPDRLNRVAAYVDAVKARIHRQVLLVAEVAEVELDDRHPNGIDWDAVRAAMGVEIPGDGGPGLRVALPRTGSAPFLDALRAQGRVHLLATPRVVTMNNEPAVMRVGTRDVAFVPASDAGGRAEGVVPETPIEGVVLSVTPQIGLDGIITMRISPRVTERAEALSSSDGDRRPVLTVREADTVVRVFEGETVVVAGLTQDRLIERSGRAPVLGAIPLLGRMFRRDRTVAMTSDLVVLLTPRIVVPGRLTAAMTKP